MLDFPLALLLARAPEMPNWEPTPAMRGVALRVLKTRIWKHVALPWREAMTDQAMKSSQHEHSGQSPGCVMCRVRTLQMRRTRYQRWPYLAVISSLLPTQFRYHLHRVAE